MQLTCPVCGVRCPVEAYLADEAARRALSSALHLPKPLADLTLHYLGLFRPHNRGLSWDRAERLLAELLVPVERGQLERRGRVWSAPLDYWRQALEQMLASRDKLTLPLKTHGYLYEIVVGLADSSERKVEQRVEQQQRERAGTQTVSTPTAAPKEIKDFLARHRRSEPKE